MKIILCTSDPVAHFAAQELSRLVREMGNTADLITGSYSDAPALYLGTFSAFPQISQKTAEPTVFDDEIFIDTSGECGIIAGICPRSILIAVYRYASELGCRFLTVGKEGEKIPRVDIASASVSVHEAPSYRHRGVCIEGAVSTENVADMIDFLPKIGMNSYFIQFREAHTFFDRWYSHIYNPELENPGSYSIAQAQQATALAAAEMAKRGILYHAVGHGWTCEPFGVPGLGWDEWTTPLPPEAEEAFAMVDGKRGLWGGVPLNTQVCMSNPDVRRKIIVNICEYICEHPTVDVLHFWLADGAFNHCECDGCKKLRPSDFYVTMLNELDDELTARGLDTRVVFLIYLDLLWPPVEMKLKNPDRFLMMFAPITRSYRKSFRADGELPPIREFVRNADVSVLPKDVAQNISYLSAWQKHFGGDGFDFDYHYMWAHIKDPGNIRLARVLCDDIKNLRDIGLNGLISCQLSRAMFPNALNMVVMGRTLWDRSCDFDALCREYYNDCYGEKMGPVVLEYMTRLSDMFFSLELEGNMDKLDQMPDCSEKNDVCEEIVDYISRFIAEHFRLTNENVFFTWLTEHAWIYSDYAILLGSVFNRAHSPVNWAPQYLEEHVRKVFAREYMYQSVFDVWEFINLAKKDFEKYMNK